MDNKIIKFLSEIYMLKRNKHEGFRLSGVEYIDSLADHITCASQIAYIIGEMEGLDGAKCASIVLFHDNGEARIGDQHKVAARYIDAHEGETNAFLEQMNFLPDTIKNKIIGLYNEYDKRNTPEGIVAKDADWVEVAIQAKIYSEQGYQNLENWIENVSTAVETKSAKEIMQEIKNIKNFTTCWWKDLKKFRYKKIKLE